MPISANGDNTLHELARAMTAGGCHSTAVALRKLAHEGYTTLEQVDSVSDWVLLSIRGIGAGRLGEVRRLTRPDWQPPSPQAIQAGNWFLSAAQFALRYWPAETLASLIRGSASPKVTEGPIEKQLALDVFARAARTAQRYCQTRELIQALSQARNDHAESPRLVYEPFPGSEMQLQALDDSQVETPAPDLPAIPLDENDVVRDNDHFAHPRCKRIEIVRRYWIARENREIKNKDAWARSRYQISSKTLLCYEREFQDQRQAILAAADGS